jgi:DNA-directed RNA polymerase specialized sigma24 family protein
MPKWRVIRCSQPEPLAVPEVPSEARPNLAGHRARTEKMLRQYLYASMLVGRTPSLLNNADRRAWVSHRTTHTFEDAVIFVLDMESCLKGLSPLQRELLSRIVLQEYSLAEAAMILRVSVRRITLKFESALDELTANLLAAGLLVVPS